MTATRHMWQARDKPLTMYNGPGGNRRSAAGCVSPSPCSNGKMAKPNLDEDSCDEYPYAAVVEGGSGAILRCTDRTENEDEGRDLSRLITSNDGCGNNPCTFQVTFGNIGGGGTPYCLDGGGANDGYEYTYQGNGNYGLASRDTNDTEHGGWVLHEPDPADYFPPHLRREFLLEDGSRTILSSRDQTTSYEGAVFHSVRNGTLVKTRAVKELLGSEKRPELQHPDLRNSKKAALQFES